MIGTGPPVADFVLYLQKQHNILGGANEQQ
jgi:hypothetical protein